MNLSFTKYHGAGNDFIVIDLRDQEVTLTQPQIAHLCDRHFGIGADGLMLLADTNKADFIMIYFNADGKESTLCGNGGRCITAFAQHLGIIDRYTSFLASDGEHDAEILKHSGKMYQIKLRMHSVAKESIKKVVMGDEGWVINTGSPHLVMLVDRVKDLDVVKEGRRLRNLPEFFPEGINVDFVEEPEDGTLFVRTYERGVEDETLSCGTGVTAAAIIQAVRQTGGQEVRKSGTAYSKRVGTPGGELEVRFRETDNNYMDIWLEGPVAYVFSGKITMGYGM